MDLDLLACDEEMMEVTPEGAYAGPSNRDEILARRQLSVDLNFHGIPLEERALPYQDPVILNDVALENMLRMEERLQQHVQPNYFRTIQKDVTPSNRQLVVSWMYEVSRVSVSPPLCCCHELDLRFGGSERA
jgi:hypothetical protein